MFKKRLLSMLSAAALTVTMALSASGSVSAEKDMNINGTYNQGTTISTFLKENYEGYGSIELNYEYLSIPETPSATFGLIAFDTEWGGWTTTSVGQTDPELGVNYTSIVGMEQIESTLNTGKDAYGFNLITDNFGEGSVKLNYVKLNDKQGQETTITGSWHKGTASAMTVTGDADIKVDANAYNIYMSGFSTFGFTNPTVDVTVTYNAQAEGYKEAALYYVDNYNTSTETWTPVDSDTYKAVEANKTVTYSFKVDDTRHSLYACFDACTVTEIKIYDKVPDDIVITGNWTKGTESTMTSSDPDVWLYAGTDNIYVFNFTLDGYLNPTVEVTANYTSIPSDGSYKQAELYSGDAKIAGDYVPVTETGEKVYNFDISRQLTSFNVCFDGCTVTKVRIYDNRSQVPEIIMNKTASQLVPMMGKAWNLGNALECTSDGTVGETLWNNKVPVSKALFDLVKANGFDTVRIPVSYMDKIIQTSDGTYTIDTAYMARVKQVVDAALDAGLFVIVNIHHDGSDGVQGKWIDISKTGAEFEAVKTKFSDVWAEIAGTFSGYDQHLIFEGMNEIMISGQNNTASTSAYTNINALNQAFVTAVRGVDGNSDRCLLIPGYNTNIDATVSGMFVKPVDTTENRLMLSVHYYDPYDFTLNENGTDEWDFDTEYMEGQIQKIATFANGLNMPVVLGEYGAIDKGNDDYRVYYIGNLNIIADSYNIVTSYWDNGYTGQYGFALFDRTNNTVTSSGEILINAINGI